VQDGGLNARIERLIEPQIDAMGYAVVRVRLTGARRKTLQVMVERTDEASMTVDDCAEISRTVSAILDVEDPIRDGYTLEVSSPGIDRPLVKPRDFERFAGHEAKIELSTPLDGRRRFKGRLLGGDDRAVRLAGDEGEIELPFELIDRAKLVLTDALIAAANKSSTE